MTRATLLPTLSLASALVLAAAPAVRAEDAPAPEEVEISTPDGMRLAGTYYPPQGRPAKGAPSVVALHMYRNERSSYAPIAPAITAKGMGLLAIDMRGHGESKFQGGKDLSIAALGRDPVLFNAMHHDAWAAVMWLRRHKEVPKGKFALLGASVGCSIAIDAAVRNPNGVACVAALTPGMNYLGVPTDEHVAKWPLGKPLLVLASEGERKQGADPIHAALKGKGCDILVVPGGRELHGTRMFGKVKDIETKLADWLFAKTDGVAVDGKVEPHEIHGRTAIAPGDDLKGVVGTSGSKLYVAVYPRPGAEHGKRMKIRLQVHPDGEGEPTKNAGPNDGSEIPSTVKKKKWICAEAALDAKALGVEKGKWFRVAVVSASTKSQPGRSHLVRVRLP